jgi:hypothetical protein
MEEAFGMLIEKLMIDFQMEQIEEYLENVLYRLLAEFDVAACISFAHQEPLHSSNFHLQLPLSLHPLG